MKIIAAKRFFNPFLPHKEKNIQKAVAGMSQFMMRSQGLDENAARKAVIAIMKNLPAWKDQAE